MLQIHSVRRSDICPTAVKTQALTCTPVPILLKLHSNENVRLCCIYLGWEIRPDFSHGR